MRGRAAHLTRIIGGVAGGRRIAVPPRGTRPTTDRVRESLFNIVTARRDLTGLAVLDLYAGSGANRVLLGALVATNILGQNTPAIAATEFDYVEMWAQDVGAMVGYHAGAAAVAETLTPFSVPPLDLAGLASQAGAQLTGMATSVSAALSPIAEGAVEGVPAVVAAAQSVAAGLPVDAALQVGQAAAYPASMLIGPMMQLAQMGTTANTAGLAGAEAAGLAAADVPTFAGDIASGTGLGGAGGLGAGMSAELGKARLVGAMSVPPTWEGSVPARMASSAMAGLGASLLRCRRQAGPWG